MKLASVYCAYLCGLLFGCTNPVNTELTNILLTAFAGMAGMACVYAYGKDQPCQN